MLVSPVALFLAQKRRGAIPQKGPGQRENRSTRVDDPSHPLQRAATPQQEAPFIIGGFALIGKSRPIEIIRFRRTKVSIVRTAVNFNSQWRYFVEIKLFDGSIKTSEAQYDYIMTKVGAAAGRLKDEICTIDVRLTDVNGPKGGVDKQCSIVVTPPGLATVRVEEQAADYYAAIDAAAATLKKSLARSLERTKSNGLR